MGNSIDLNKIVRFYHKDDGKPKHLWLLLMGAILTLVVTIVVAIIGPQNTNRNEIEIRIFAWVVVAIFGTITLVLSSFLVISFKVIYSRKLVIKALLNTGSLVKAIVTKQSCSQVRATNQGAVGNYLDYTYLDQNNISQSGSAFIRSYAPLENLVDVDIIMHGNKSILVKLKNSEEFKEKLNQEHTYFKPPRG